MEYITLNAADMTVRLTTDNVPAGQLGVVLTDTTDNTVVVVTGTAQTLRSLVYDGLTHPIPEGVPLVDPVV